MAKVMRAMLRDGDNGPLIGNSPKMLGVRTGSGEHDDICPDEYGIVHCGPRGMSVAPSIYVIPLHRVPKRLRNLVKGARGANNYRLWRLGEITFVDGPAA